MIKSNSDSTVRRAVQEMLGHFSIVITSDTCTSVLPQFAREAAEAAVRLDQGRGPVPIGTHRGPKEKPQAT